MKLDKQVMIDSYRWTSFSPERRGESDFNYYSDMLKEDLEKLGENKGNYEAKFIDKVMTIFHRQSKCASPMITGPANFNNRRNAKLWESRDKAINDFDHWRNKYFNAVNRVRTLSPEEEIDKTLEELDALEERKDVFKKADKIKNLEDKLLYLENEGYLTDSVKSYVTQGFQLCRTSLTTKIRERKEKLEVMRRRIETKSSFERINFQGGYIDLDNDRVVIKHDSKPSKEILDVLRSSGFKYSPKTVSWVRKHTENAIYTAKRIIPQIEIKA